jgi:hypothetical protein
MLTCQQVALVYLLHAAPSGHWYAPQQACSFGVICHTELPQLVVLTADPLKARKAYHRLGLHMSGENSVVVS